MGYPCFVAMLFPQFLDATPAVWAGKDQRNLVSPRSAIFFPRQAHKNRQHTPCLKRFIPIPLVAFFYPPVIKRGLLENSPFIVDFPTQTSIDRRLSIATFDHQKLSSLETHGFASHYHNSMMGGPIPMCRLHPSENVSHPNRSDLFACSIGVTFMGLKLVKGRRLGNILNVSVYF